MDKVKGITKGGWHPPGKNGGKESWRGDFKGINQVAGWVGKGKSSDSSTHADEHQSRPLATLKDPTAFGPPPKNVNYHGGIAVPNAITPDRRGWGAPLAAEAIEAAPKVEERSHARHATEQEAQPAAPPPVPYRVDTTGLATTDLPEPPVRRVEQDVESGPIPIKSLAGQKPKPNLPPRLPPRQNSRPSSSDISSPSQYSPITMEDRTQSSYINKGALNRLGSAGVSVPGFGIGTSDETANPWQDQHSGNNSKDSPRNSRPSINPSSTTNELQTRFAKMTTNSNAPNSPSQGTTLAEKQAALKTAGSFRDDPSSVSLSDAKSAASTANNFRERHGNQVASGWQSANGLNKKYGIATKLNNYGSGGVAPSNIEAPSPPVTPQAIDSSSHQVFKKAPPPPPPKKILGDPLASRTPPPPPVPLFSKPKS